MAYSSLKLIHLTYIATYVVANKYVTTDCEVI